MLLELFDDPVGFCDLRLGLFLFSPSLGIDEQTNRFPIGRIRNHSHRQNHQVGIQEGLVAQQALSNLNFQAAVAVAFHLVDFTAREHGTALFLHTQVEELGRHVVFQHDIHDGRRIVVLTRSSHGISQTA